MTTYAVAKNFIPAWMHAIPMALGVTLGLFILMYRLIWTEYPEVDEAPPVPIPNVIWEDPPIVEIIDKRVEKPAPPELDPPTPAKPEVADNRSVTHIPNVTVIDEVDVGGITDYRMPVPQVMISPKYPASAINRELEGYVDVRFDISVTGATENIAVLAAVPEGVFETAAVDAVSRWRYLPQLSDGKPVPFNGMTQRVRFEMRK